MLRIVLYRYNSFLRDIYTSEKVQEHGEVIHIKKEIKDVNVRCTLCT